MNDTIEVCHIVVMNNDEMDMLKLIGTGIIAVKEGRALPPAPTGEQQQVMFGLFERILEM